MNTRKYPIPAQEDDPRFKLSLVLDICEVLQRHGYPAFTSANILDLVELQQTLYRFIYVSDEPTGSFHEGENK